MDDLEKPERSVDDPITTKLIEYFDSIIKDKTTEELFSIKLNNNLTDGDNSERIWVEHRTALHEKIINLYLRNSVSAEEPFALFLGGGSASGKSTVRDEILIPWLEAPIVVIDCDLIKSELPEYGIYRCINSEKAAKIVHIESRDIAMQIFRECVDRSCSFIYDSTLAGEPKEYEELLDFCKAKDYRLILVGVCTPIEVAIERENKRYRKTGRKVELGSIEYTHLYFPKTFHALEPKFEIVQIFDNSISGDAPTLVAQRYDEVLEVFDKTLYNEFKKRGE